MVVFTDSAWTGDREPGPRTRVQNDTNVEHPCMFTARQHGSVYQPLLTEKYKASVAVLEAI